MLRLTLARDRLLCGYGTNKDPSVDQSCSGDSESGCRPSIFFGPQRDALHLITKKLHAAVVLRPKTLKDMQPRLYVLSLPGGFLEVAKLWNEQALKLGQQIKPQLILGELKQTTSVLESAADIYQQDLQPSGESLPAELLALRLRIEAGIDQNALREHWQFSGVDAARYESFLIYWNEPEINSSGKMQSTMFFEQARSLSSYRGAVCFSIQALQGSESLPMAFAECGDRQHHQRAAKRFGDILQSIWYRDELLGMSYAGQSRGASSWLPMEPHSLASLGHSDGIIAWHIPLQKSFELRFRLTQGFDELMQPLAPIEQTFAHLREMDRSWLKTVKSAPAHVPVELQKAYQRTLLTLKQMQDPGGGIIAAPEFHFDLNSCGGYAYCWGRDAGFISYAMDICGMDRESADFYRYMQRCQSADGSFLHRHDMEGHLGASWGILQPDETASVVFGFWQHVLLADDKALAEELRPMVDKAAAWLCHSRHPLVPELPIPGFDLWEEREGVHYYSVAAMAAGLKAAIDLYSYMKWSVPMEWLARSRELIQICNSDRFIQKHEGKTRLARSLFRRIPAHKRSAIEEQGGKVSVHHSPAGRAIYSLEQDFVIDISQVAAVYPYQVLDLKKHRDAYHDLLDAIMERLWRDDIGGLGRYEADHYRDANPWILTTLWLALAAVHQQPDEAGPKAKQIQLAKVAFQWVIQHMPAEGQLPEQIDPVTGSPSWVMPLTWSHAMFALAIQQLPKEVYS